MYKFLFLVFIFTSILCEAQRVKIEIEFRYGKPDCSGKFKTDVEIQNSKVDMPLANQRFYVYQSGNCIDSLKTNDSGFVWIKYLPGNYSLYEPWKHFRKTPDDSPLSDFFTDCLEEQWLKPNYYLTIKDKGEYKVEYLEISASRCLFQFSCLKLRHLPSEIKR